jgi:hypothetical protein
VIANDGDARADPFNFKYTVIPRVHPTALPSRFIVMVIDAVKQARFPITSSRLPHRSEDQAAC